MCITAYLDTANWYELAEGRVPTEKFELAVKNGSVIPVLSFIHLMEFASRGEKHRNKVTNYIDHVNALAPIKWIKVLPAIAQAELANAFLRYHGLIPQPIQVFASSLTDSLPAEIPGLDKAEARTYSMTKVVEILCGQERYKAHRSFRRTNAVKHIAHLRRLRRESKVPLSPKGADYVQNLVSDMPSLVCTAAGLIVEVTPERRRRFVEQLQWEDCPVSALRVAAMVGWSMTSGGEAPSDFEDIFHLAALAYCDVAFADKRTCDALRKGKAFKIPLLNSKFQSWLNDLSA